MPQPPSSAPAGPAGTPTGSPPLAERREHQVVRHGETVADPWHWLRDKNDPEVLRHLEAENAYTAAMTHEVRAFGEALYQEILGRIKQTDLSVPTRHGRFYYYGRTEEGKQYAILCRRAARPDGTDDLDAPEEIVLDQNVAAAGHTYFALGAYDVSDDGRLVLFSTDTTGFRQYTLYVKDLSTGLISAPLAERVTSVDWMADNRHFVYTTEDATTKRSNQAWRAAIDRAESAELLFEEPDELYRIGVGRTRDKAYVILGSYSTDTWEHHLLRTDDLRGRFRVVLPRHKGHKYSVEHRQGLLYLRTNREAKNFRLVTAPIDEPTRWTEVVAHREDTLLDAMSVFRDHLVVQEKREVLVRFRVLDFGAGAWREVGFPESIYDADLSGHPEWDAPAFRITYESMITPPTVYDVRLADGALILRKQTEVLGGYDPSRYGTERRWAIARDGTRIPLSILYKQGTPLDAEGPLYLYGYGAYGLGMSASFSTSTISVVDRGVIYVVAHVRGGDDLGEAWHDDGMLMKKKNSFFDFIDAAEWMIAQKMTRPDRLVIEGGSAGGLLVGAVLNMRPDLWKAAHAAVPFVDVMNTMTDPTLPLTVGEYLEWGDPNDRAAYDYMKSYSPYDNVERKAYPALLVTTSINDSQVMYWEPAKWVAKLRHLKTDKNPLLLKCNMGAGHGGASGRYDRLKEIAFEYAWLLTELGITR